MSSQPAAGTSLPLLRLSVPQYHAMRRAGILTEDDRVELLGGLLVSKMTKNPPHSLATELTRRALEQALGSVGGRWHVRSQQPITTPDSEPEPDVAVVAGGLRDYGEAHPSPADVALVVEVADESLRRDRKDKLAIYARAGIAAYWIVNLVDRHVEVFGAPSAEGYGSSASYAAGETVTLVVDGLVTELGVDALLP
jgi:Uma2 family endonuclease